MTNITSIWRLGNVTFYVTNFDEQITMFTDATKLLGEYGAYLYQNIDRSELSLDIYSDNISSILDEFFSNDCLQLTRYDGKIQFVEPHAEGSSLGYYKTGSKELKLKFISADPYKYNSSAQNCSTYLNSTSNDFYLYHDGDFESPLEFGIESYNLTTVTINHAIAVNKSHNIGYKTTFTGNENLTIYKLTGVPTLDEYREDGVYYPPYDNEDSWTWSKIEPGSTLDEIDNIYLTNTIKYMVVPHGLEGLRAVNFYKGTYPLNKSSTDRYLSIQNIDFIQYNGENLLPEVLVWKRNVSQWENIKQFDTINSGIASFNFGSNLSNYNVDNRISFIIGGSKESALPFYYLIYTPTNTLAMDFVKYYNAVDYDIVSIFTVPKSGHYTDSIITFDGANNFNGTAKITLHPASVQSQSNRSFYYRNLLHSEYISGVNFSGNHTITFPSLGFSTVACKISIDQHHNSTIIGVKSYNTSNSGDGLIYFRENPDYTVTSNITNNYYSFIKSKTYKAPVRDLIITNYLNPSEQLNFSCTFIGKTYLYNESKYYEYNAFDNISSYMSLHNGAIIEDSVWLNPNGYIIYNIASIGKFTHIPEYLWTGNGSLVAYLNLSNSTNIDDWDKAYIFRDGYYNPAYSDEVKLIGKNNFLIRLQSNITSNLSSFLLRSDVYVDDTAYLNLIPNVTNIVNVTGLNINNSVKFIYKYRHSYI